jgi:membrane protein required for colicin V production
MNTFDIVILLVLSIFIIRGIFRGFINELITLIGLVIGYLVAITYLDLAMSFIISIFPDLPEIAIKIVCFAGIFIGTNILLRFAAHFLTKTLSFAMLGWLNRLLGGLVGLLKSILIITIITFLTNLLPYSEVLLNKIGTNNSYFYPLFRMLGPQLYMQIQNWLS